MLMTILKLKNVLSIDSVKYFAVIWFFKAYQWNTSNSNHELDKTLQQKLIICRSPIYQKTVKITSTTVA